MKKSRFFLFIIVLALALTSTVIALASPVDEMVQQAEASDNPLQAFRDAQAEIMQQIEQLQSQIDEQESLINGLEADIAQLDVKMTALNQQIIAAQTAIEETQAIIDQLTLDIADAEARLAERMELLQERLVNVYIYGDIKLLDVVLETADFQDFLTVYDMVERIVEQDKKLAEQITAEREQIKADKAEQEQMLADLVELQHEQEDMMFDLKQVQAEKEAAINEAEWTIAEYNAYEDSLAEIASAATAKIRELLKNSDSTLTYGGSMIWPLPSPYGSGYITSEYGWRTHPIYGDQRLHTGIDIGAPGGTPIFAAADGRVILREYYGGYGNCIMLDHGDGIVTLYAHQSAFGGFSVGEYVVTGDVIGYVGTTGTSTGNHLHFEVRKNGEHTSPWNYL